MFTPLTTAFGEGMRYKAKGNILWLLHRIHIFGMSMSAFNPPLHEQMLDLYKTPLFSLGELALAALLVFHAVNGTRIAILELRPHLWEKQEVATRYSLIIVGVLLVPTLVIMAAKSLSHYLTYGFK